MSEWKSDRYWRNRPVEERIKNARIPVRYRDKTFADYNTEVGSINALKAIKKWAESIQDYMNDGMGLVISGPTGVGKTHLAQAALKHIVSKNNLSGIFITADRYLDMIYEETRNNGELSDGYSDPNLLMYMRRVLDVLVLDGLGSERTMTEYARNALSALIINRYEEKKITVITSTYTMETIASRYGQPLASILHESAFIIEMDGEDYRVQYARQ